ncbi:MAG: hypothetical protein U5K00_24585 [Melioribacteraceae bacterium]|nr:hypothetical protein [Melioribacteraceae bacterium]
MNNVYSVRDTDIQFGNSWQDWQNAVEQAPTFTTAIMMVFIILLTKIIMATVEYKRRQAGFII